MIFLLSGCLTSRPRSAGQSVEPAHKNARVMVNHHAGLSPWFAMSGHAALDARWSVPGFTACVGFRFYRPLSAVGHLVSGSTASVHYGLHLSICRLALGRIVTDNNPPPLNNDARGQNVKKD